MKDRILPHVEDSGQRPKVSVVIRCRNEYPVVLGTIYSFLEDLEYSGYPYEFVVASNKSDDDGPEVLVDKFRRWTRGGFLKVVRYDEKPSTWGAANAGVAASTGDVVAVADAHVSVKTGTMHQLVQGAVTHGGLWHAAVNRWGDLDHIRTYGYDLTLTANFWGNPCLYLPPGVTGDDGRPRPHAVAMMGACLVVMTRTTWEHIGPYSPEFGCYGGGEPYLALRSWMAGEGCWCAPEALCRHAFGIRPRWDAVKRDRQARRSVYKRGGKIVRNLKNGDEILAYGDGYQKEDLGMWRNFMIAAYVLGGQRWLDHVRGRFEAKSPRSAQRLAMIAKDVACRCAHDRVSFASRVVRTFDELLADPPWVHCGRHAREDYSSLCSVDSARSPAT